MLFRSPRLKLHVVKEQSATERMAIFSGFVALVATLTVMPDLPVAGVALIVARFVPAGRELVQRVIGECRAAGQVTERVLHLCEAGARGLLAHWGARRGD